MSVSSRPQPVKTAVGDEESADAAEGAASWRVEHGQPLRSEAEVEARRKVAHLGLGSKSLVLEIILAEGVHLGIDAGVVGDRPQVAASEGEAHAAGPARRAPTVGREEGG